MNDTPGRRAGQLRLMQRSYPRLLTATEDFFRHLTSDEPMEDETWHEVRHLMQSPFNAYRNYYMSDITSPVIEVSMACLKMEMVRGSEVSLVLYLANLTSLLDEIITHTEGTILTLLQSWENFFPDNYIPPGEQIVTPEDLAEHVLAIRTHLVIFTLKRLQLNGSEAFSPLEQVVKIFCDVNVTVDALRGFLNNEKEEAPPKFRPIHGVDLTTGWPRETFVTRLKAVCNLLPDQVVQPGMSLDLSAAEDAFPFESSLGSLRKFVETCFKKTRALLEPSQQFYTPSAHLGGSDFGSGIDSQIQADLESQSQLERERARNARYACNKHLEILQTQVADIKL